MAAADVDAESQLSDNYKERQAHFKKRPVSARGLTMMQPPKHVLLELDEDGDLHSVDGDSDAPAVVGATEGDSPPAPARPGIVGAVLVTMGVIWQLLFCWLGPDDDDGDRPEGAIAVRRPLAPPQQQHGIKKTE